MLVTRAVLVPGAALVVGGRVTKHRRLAALGIDPRDAAFLEAKKRYIANVLLAAAGADARTTGSTT